MRSRWDRTNNYLFRYKYIIPLGLKVEYVICFLR